jgi:hypothetical protein
MRRALGWTIASTWMLCGVPSWAQTTQEAARTAYDDAVSAHERSDYPRAARGFAHADRLVPKDSALRDAIAEATRADDAPLALMLVARARRSPQNAELQQIAANARDKFRGRAGRYQSECAEPCSVEVDGKEADPELEGWIPVGSHVIALTTEGYRDEHRVEILPLETTVVTFARPKPKPAAITLSTPQALPESPAGPSRGGLSPAWFWAGAGLTLALAGASVASGLDVTSRRDDFDAHRCSAAGSAACDDLASSGRGAVTRTNILLGGAVVVGVATLVTMFFVRWKSAPTVARQF